MGGIEQIAVTLAYHSPESGVLHIMLSALILLVLTCLEIDVKVVTALG